MTDTIIGAIIGVGGAIIGVILAGPITYWFSKKLIRESHRNNLVAIQLIEFTKAAAVFRAAFVDVEFDLHQNIEGITQEKITKIFNRTTLIGHEKAKILFQPFLNKSDLVGFNKSMGRIY